MSRRRKKRIPRSVALFRKLPALRTVTVRVDGKKRIFDLHDEFRLTKSDVESRFYTEAEQFLFWRSLLKIARNHLREAEAAYEEQRAWVDIALRQWATENDEGFAEWELKTRVDVDPTVIKARRKLTKRSLPGYRYKGFASLNDLLVR